jgi:hypothetical protein
MKQEISLEDAKQQIFLCACHIYSAYVQKFNIEPGQDEKYLAKATGGAIQEKGPVVTIPAG